MLGKDQPVILQLLEIPDEKAQKALKGVMMELDDCAFPLLHGMVPASDPEVAFKDADVALLVGALGRRSRRVHPFPVELGERHPRHCRGLTVPPLPQAWGSGRPKAGEEWGTRSTDRLPRPWRKPKLKLWRS